MNLGVKKVFDMDLQLQIQLSILKCVFYDFYFNYTFAPSTL